MFLVLGLSIFISLLNISHVLLGALRTPLGHVYLWTGHYYADYFVYIQAMVQGARGRWLVENPFATDDKSRTFLSWELDLLLGKVAGFFHLSPFLAYWGAVAFLTLVLCLLIFWTIRQLLAKRPFMVQFSAFLLTVFAAPFFRISLSGLKIVPFDFWYAPSFLFKRFGGIPRHLLDQIVILLVASIAGKALTRIKSLSFRKIVLTGLGIGLLLAFLMTFSPYIGVILLAAIGLTGVLFGYKSKIRFHYLLFLASILLLVLPAALGVKYFSAFSGPISRSVEWNIPQQLHPNLINFLLTLGPIVLFLPFGLKDYFRSLTTIKVIIFLLTLLSLSLFFSPLGVLIQTTNLRFLTPLIYLLFGTLAALGLAKLKIIIPGTLVLLLLFLPSNFSFLKTQINDPNLFSIVSYLPTQIYQGMLFLDTEKDTRAVLTSPASFWGNILPVFCDKRVYFGLPLFTPQFEEKKALAARFYEGMMKEAEAEKFFQENNLGFIFWTDLDGTAQEKLASYRWLKPVFKNQRVTVFRAEFDR